MIHLSLMKIDQAGLPANSECTCLLANNLLRTTNRTNKSLYSTVRAVTNTNKQKSRNIHLSSSNESLTARLYTWPETNSQAAIIP